MIANYGLVRIHWKKFKRAVTISSYGNEGWLYMTPITLREFFDDLGITEKDCREAFAEGKK